MQVEILLRMPLKTLAKAICVSKKWASTIRSKHFKDLYLLQSAKRPRALFVYFAIGSDALLRSVYQEEKPLFSSGQQQMLVSIDREADYVFSHPVRGLVCLQWGAKTVICNPGARKILTLPEIQKRTVADWGTAAYLGYDEVTDVYKVLCMRVQEAKECQVFTVGSGGDESWRWIICKHPHTPLTNAICKGGVLYYGAWYRDEKHFIVSFNVTSEEFNVIDLPEGIKTDAYSNMVNYNGEIALVNETAGNWRTNRIEVHHWEEESAGDLTFCFRGTVGTGELVFTPDYEPQGPFFVLYYDTVTKKLTRVEIQGVAGTGDHMVRTFLDHVDSPLLM
ncbi:unnamed protein product [Microthlaspi erraticum]|uniref:Uncharacterized protein n=1 Tax=Microthlaspi erraticum TaxID=1685480 RepID=A0A6D2IV37_9BRAS|nr:unnamed protein product [Microthlaspi erraticum]